MSVAIRVQNLGKKYTLLHGGERATSLRDAIMDGARKAGRFLASGGRVEQPTREEFWALRDVSFDIRQGDRVGIIGRNGAGKSTLLKILSRITDPTEGEVKIKGRVASLLEVGTGFHPELTGRENIFLNGAILGMSRVEIARKFDEIVAFAEVERFLDTPVKRYSSGMYVRLAFAVAAHLEPEVLIVDEVLAVGDAQFQKKCLGKMKEVGSEGRTVIFVSHDMTAIKSLCSEVVLLAGGRVVGRGDAEEQIARYLDLHGKKAAWDSASPFPLGPHLTLERFTFNPNPVYCGERAGFALELKASHRASVQALTVVFYTRHGVRVSVIDLRKSDGPYVIGEGERVVVEGAVHAVPFVEGDYTVSLYVDYGVVRQEFLELAALTVQARPAATGFAPYPASVCGVVKLDVGFSHAAQGG